MTPRRERPRAANGDAEAAADAAKKVCTRIIESASRPARPVIQALEACKTPGGRATPLRAWV